MTHGIDEGFDKEQLSFLKKWEAAYDSDKRVNLFKKLLKKIPKDDLHRLLKHLSEDPRMDVRFEHGYTLRLGIAFEMTERGEYSEALAILFKKTASDYFSGEMAKALIFSSLKDLSGECLKSLLSAGVPLKYDERTSSYAASATFYLNLKALSMLVERESEEKLNEALLMACKNGETEYVQMILDHGGDARSCDVIRGVSCLGYVMKKANPRLLKMLLDHGADVREKGYRTPPIQMLGWEPSADADHEETVRLFKEAGGDIEVLHDNRTGLFNAIITGREAAARAFAMNGARLTMRGFNSWDKAKEYKLDGLADFLLSLNEKRLFSEDNVDSEKTLVKKRI